MSRVAHKQLPSSSHQTAVNAASSSFNEQERTADRFTDAIKLLDIDVDDFGYSGALNFDLYDRYLSEYSFDH